MGTFNILYTYRRLGADNGMYTVVHLDNNLKMAFEHLKAIRQTRTDLWLTCSAVWWVLSQNC